MKQYLKMADVFADSAKKGTSLVCGKTLVAKFVDGVECEYSVHAINSHDELVQMNQELLDIIRRVIDTSKELEGKVGTSSWTDEYKQCAIDTDSSLSDLLDKYKQKGGAE